MAKELKFNITPEVGAGVYSNFAIVSHTVSEVVVDFAQIFPSNPNTDAVVRSRVILAPEHAKRLMRALIENLGKYEEQYGEIRLNDPQASGPIREGVPFDKCGKA